MLRTSTPIESTIILLLTVRLLHIGEAVGKIVDVSVITLFDGPSSQLWFVGARDGGPDTLKRAVVLTAVKDAARR
jgi:hypothetical protein